MIFVSVLIWDEDIAKITVKRKKKTLEISQITSEPILFETLK